MHTWFECNVSFERTGEDGFVKTVTEPYLVDALSFTEAEARIAKEVQPFASGDFMVAKIKRARIHELFHADGDKWYRFKVNYIMLDEDKGVEKKSAQTMMVQANDLPSAITTLIDCMKNSLGDYEIVSATETMILDVYEYEPQDDSDV